MKIALSREAVQRAVSSVRDDLGRVDRVRLDVIAALAGDDGRIHLHDALRSLYPDQERQAALTAFRQFRGRIAGAAKDIGLALALETDHQTRSKPEQRWCWFIGDDGAERAAAQLTKSETAVAPPRTRQDAIGKRLVRYFISYAHADAPLKEDLLRRLHVFFEISPLYQFVPWQDLNIEIGSGWHEQIQSAIGACDFGLLLVSPAFLASEYITEHELSLFVESGDTSSLPRRRAAPVALKPVRFDGTMSLKGLERRQIFVDDGKAYQQVSGNAKKDAFAERLFVKIVQMLDANPRFAAHAAAKPASSEPREAHPTDIGQRLREQIDPQLLGRPFVAPSGRRDSQGNLDEVTDGERGDALAYLNEWAGDTSGPSYCALLGEYGMGKTTTSMAFARDMLIAREATPSLPLPIYLDLRHIGDLAKSEPVLDTIIDTVLRRSWQSGAADSRLSGQEVIRLVREEGAIAIFDGLDEVLVHLSPAAGQRFTRELFRILPPALFPRSREKTTPGRPGRVLITCRTHYFRSLREQKTALTAEGRDGVRADDYRVFVLLPFTHNQIRLYLEQTLPGEDIDRALKTIAAVHNLTELAERPYTLGLIAENFPQMERWKLAGLRVTGVMLYRHMVMSWLERDTGKHQITPDHKRQLMEYFAAALWRSNKRAWSVGDVEQWLIDLIRARPDLAAHYEGKDRELLKEDLRTATFLVREGEDDFRFAHTSLLEFFLAGYLHRALSTGRIGDWDLPRPSRETFDFLGQLLDEGDADAAIAGLRSIRDAYRPSTSENGFAYVLRAHDKGYPSPSPAGFRLDGANLSRERVGGNVERPLLNLRGTSLRGARLWETRFHHVDLTDADFANADLTRTEVIDARADRAVFAGAVLSGSLFRQTSLDRADFTDARPYRVRFLACRLSGSEGLSAALPAAIFALCEPASLDTPAPGTGVRLGVLQGHQGWVSACAFAPDGAALASAGDDDTVQLWDPASGECRAVLQGHQGGVWACAFAPDGAALASAGFDGTVRLWDPASGECRAVLQGHQGGVRACAFAPDGAALASAGSDGTVRLWDPASGECRSVLQGHQRGVWACAFAPDGAVLASAGSDGTVRLWDPASGECRAVLQGHQGRVSACAFAPDGAALASAGSDGTVRLWDPASGECRAVLQGHQGWVWACAFAPDGAALASAGDDGTVQLWDPASGECRAVLQGHQGRVSACAFAPDGAALASAGFDGTVRLWDPASGECRAVLQGHQGGVRACAFAPDGAALASAGDDGTVRLWDPASGECRAVLQGHQRGVWACAFAPDGAVLASAGDDGTVRLWDPASGECRAVLQGHQGRVSACAFAPDGAALASAGSDGTVRLWDPASGECRAVLQGHQGWVWACAFAPDGAALASAGDDGTVQLWDPASGECRAVLQGHQGWVWACAFAPDGAALASAGDDGTVRLWDPASGECRAVLQGHQGGVWACAFAPDGAALASAGFDGTVRLWDPASGECRAVLQGHQGGVRACAFAPDGAALASAGFDGTVRLWDPASGAEILYWQLSTDGAWAALDPVNNRILRVSGEAWRWLAWLIRDAGGTIASYPAEIFGPLPTTISRRRRLPEHRRRREEARGHN